MGASITELLRAPIATIAARVAAGDVSALELADASIAAATDRGGRDGLGAFLHVSADEARGAAAAIDAARGRGDALGPLAGVPVAVKDLLATQGTPTTAASRMLTRDGGSDPGQGWRPPYDATAVARLRAAGAVLVGKTNLDEFAMGSSNENSGFFPARNPWDPTRVPGGSSGGSAVAVAAGMVPGSLGTDTGGSIRQPAALTGTVGVKPTYGRVSRLGVVAFASSLDQVGPFAGDVASAAALLEAIAGRDPGDATSADVHARGFVEACSRGEAGAKGLRLGVPRQYFGEGVEPAVEEAVRAAIDRLVTLGATIVDVDLPHTRYALATYYVIAGAEASSNLARFDGVRFGLRKGEGGASGGLLSAGLGAMYRASRSAGLGLEVQRRILLGTFVLSAGYHDAYYLRAQRVRTLVARDFDAAFEKVDAIVAPTSPTVAFRIGERADDPIAMYRGDVLTLPASLAGLPAMSVPCGLAPATAERPALPVGLQLVGRAFDEATLFAIARAHEAVTPSIGAPP